MSHLEATERAQRRIAGEFVAEPELPPRFAFEHGEEQTFLLCPRCGSSELLLRGAAFAPEIEPTFVSVGVRCACGVYFRLLFERTEDGVLIEIEED